MQKFSCSVVQVAISLRHSIVALSTCHLQLNKDQVLSNDYKTRRKISTANKSQGESRIQLVNNNNNNKHCLASTRSGVLCIMCKKKTRFWLDIFSAS